MRNLLSTFLESYFPGLQLLGATGNGGEGIKKCLELAPDLVIIDLHLPEMNGFEILRLLKTKFPEIKILIFTGNTSQQTIEHAVRGNADGLINKISGLEDLEKAIHVLSEDRRYFPPAIVDEVVRLRKKLSN